MVARDVETHAAGGYGPPGGGPPGYGGPPGFAPPPGGQGYGPPPGAFDQAPLFGPPGFGPGGFAPPPTQSGGPTENLAVISLVLGLVSLPGGCCCTVLVAPLAIGGVTTGIMALNKISASGGALGGKPLAIGGIVCSGVSLLVGVAALVLRFGMLATHLFK